ncbi:MAG: thioredoxin family protein [Psychromonas sp.]
MESSLGFQSEYQSETMTFADISDLRGDTLLEFGAPWCPHCQIASELIKAVFTDQSTLSHIKVYDGKGKRLGREFNVKLWPTVILLRDGHEVSRVVRPANAEQMTQLTQGVDSI